MAAVRSLGLHEPVALKWLIRESKLDERATENVDYQWKTLSAHDDFDNAGRKGFEAEEEITFTKTCVVWSRGGVVMRSFSFEVEKEEIVDALFATFKKPRKGKGVAGKSLLKSNRQSTLGNSVPLPENGSSTTDTTSQGTSVSDKTGQDLLDWIREEDVGSEEARAMVVVLKTQAHVFFLGGDSHIVPIPFEVDSVWATSNGVVFQRKVIDTRPTTPTTVQSKSHGLREYRPATRSWVMTTPGMGTPGMAMGGSPEKPQHTSSSSSTLIQKWPLKSRTDSMIPRLFTLVDPGLDMGLVAAHATSAPFTGKPDKDYSILDINEELVYISPENESPWKTAEDKPLLFAITYNDRMNQFTAWSGRYRERESTLVDHDSRRRTTSHKRRSSHFDLATGTTTPVARQSSLREGMFSQSRISNSDEFRNNDDDDFATQLSQEFADIGLPSKASRRVSSLMARTDLAANDRTSFSEFAGARNASVYSNSSSFIATPVDRFLESLNGSSDLRPSEGIELQETVSGLSKELLFDRVASFPCGFAPSSTTSDLPRHKRYKVFSIMNSQGAPHCVKRSVPVTFCIMDKTTNGLILLTLVVEKKKNEKLKPPFRKKKNKMNGSNSDVAVHMTEASHASNVLDCCKVHDGAISRLLIMTKTIGGNGDLTLQAPWGNLFKVDIPCPLLKHNVYSIEHSLIKNISSDSFPPEMSHDLFYLGHASSRGKVDVIGKDGQKHRLQIQLEPRNSLVKNVLETCQFALQDDDRSGDGILVAWWEVQKWLRLLDEGEEHLEWTAMVVVLFSMAVYFPWLASPSWGWIIEENTPQPEKSTINPHSNEFISHCASLAREYLVSPVGEVATGIEGYLPTAISKTPEKRQKALAVILVALHLLREEKKLSIVTAEGPYAEDGLLAPVLAQIGGWLDWPSWTWKEDGYYGCEMGSIDRWAFEDLRITSLEVPKQPIEPPSIFEYIESAYSGADTTFMTLVDLVENRADPTIRPAIQTWAEKLTPRTFMILGFLNDLRGKETVSEKVELLLNWKITCNIIDTLPDGMAVPLYEAILRSQPRPAPSWSSSLLRLVERDDLLISKMNDNMEPPVLDSLTSQSHDAVRDVRRIGQLALESNTVDSFEASAEADRQALRRLIFPHDRRYEEADRILNQSRPSTAACEREPDWSDATYLEAQGHVVQLVALRTFSIPVGRGMLLFSSRIPLLTEKLPMPSFSLQCVVKPSNVTMSAERSAFTEEKAAWAFFHNGVATGLSISKSVKGIDTSWILFNKPPELTNRHAGFLLALGLNGHLKTLAKWVAFKYLTPKHTMTSVGLLLGLSASFLGTMDTFITRLLCVHVTRMLPAGSAELNLSPLTQTAGVMGIGLLYCGCQHRRMSEVMLSEIENLDPEENTLSQEILRDEGYRLAAGFALGFINLGKGKEMRGLRDMHIVDRLLAIAVGTKNVDVVHILDKATAGAIVAVALIYMKSNDETIARRIDIPDTSVQFDYVRPDFFLLRTLAKHLIMWDSIQPTEKWIKKAVPRSLQKKYLLRNIRRLRTDDLPLYNILAGLCFAIGLRFAGSGSTEARDILLHYLDQFKRICHLESLFNYDRKLTSNAVRNCQDIVALSAAAVMAGTGDIPVFRRLRSLHGRVGADTPFGSHMAAHMAVGLLFLGGGTFTLGTSNLAIASLLCAFYPIFPKDFLDNKCHLQALRHLWVLAVEPRCLVPRDIDTRRAMSVPITLNFKSGTTRATTAPCLLPDLSELNTIVLQSPDHWELTLDFAESQLIREKFSTGDQSVYLRKRPVNAVSNLTVFEKTLLALSQQQDILNTTLETDDPQLRDELANPLVFRYGKHPLQARFPSRHWREWVFSLPPFKDLDATDKALVLPSSLMLRRHKRSSTEDAVGSAVWLRPSAVDVRLMLQATIQNLLWIERGEGCGADVLRDRLYQFRLLFAWLDQSKRSKSGADDKNAALGLWISEDLLESYRWKLWGIRTGNVEELS
ncbi:20S cyclosome subunit [Ascosphaera apis ARSEF 7405]|uniref:20S cyclosome subunit n=1 Tax=Ascosphaera apis ARSEF 7405 TaxID=392613 RepID=A0A167WI70_9EURO|nr:20S cyclosome subunit [Ascosphaera apis ARSEF 7405]